MMVHIRGLGDLAVNHLLQGVDALAVGAESVLLSKLARVLGKFLASSWQLVSAKLGYV